MNFEEFEKEELPRINNTIAQGREVHPLNIDDLVEAFESAMAALREERERCAKIAEDEKFTGNCQEDQSVADSVYYEQQRRIGNNLACQEIAEKIRRGK